MANQRTLCFVVAPKNKSNPVPTLYHALAVARPPTQLGAVTADWLMR